ncbi:MAG: radical SAM/SPASM domain-containing protein [Lentimicrobium sp.]|jgi:spiro-SPASM protein|nr:radical SAM/SPASM domain-containing protein [Lentimicrobium sp.]
MDINKNNLVACLNSFYKNESEGDFYPVYYGIEISRFCNFECIMCPNPQYLPNEKGNMTFEVFTKIVDEIAPYAQIIKLHWIGEPLINKNIVKMIKYARAKTDAQLFMSTNGSLLKGKLAEEIRTSGLDKIIFSLDGNSKESFEKIRIKGNFDEVVSNVHNFVEDVEKLGGPKCEVKIIQFESNESEIEEFKKRWNTYKNTIVHVMWLSTWAGQLENLENLSSSLSPYASLKREACADLWFKMQFDWTGKVALCCWDWSNKVILGDINVDTLKDIWQSEKIISERKKHLSNQFLGICKNCTEWAKVEEYEFWYSYERLKENARMIWAGRGDSETLRVLKDSLGI